MTTDRCAVYELRQYTLHPGTRDAFVELFDAELLETQDATGMQVLGQFRDLDRPDMFVWLRGFADMERRRAALSAFYTGPTWAAHGRAANEMMIDSDDVLLLEPADGEHLDVGPRPAPGSHAAGSAEVAVVVCPLRPEDTGSYIEGYRRRLVPLLRGAGGEPLVAFQSLHAPNTFPGLPVREGEHVVVTLMLFADPGAAPDLRAYRAAADELEAVATGPVQRLRLSPTARSAMR